MDNWILISLVAAILVVVIVLFNIVTGRRNQVEFAFASVDAQFKKRYDLIPNLVAVCEKYMGYEQKVLQELGATRSRMVTGTPDERVALDRTFSTQMRSIFALAESYPELRAAESFSLLQRSLNEVEEQLAASRRAFNAAVTAYNNAIQMFPTNVIARAMGCKPRAWFEAAPEEREPVRVWR